MESISKTTKIFLDFRPFRALFLLSARRKEVTSITSSTSSQFTVLKCQISTLKIGSCGGQCRDIQNMHETHQEHYRNEYLWVKGMSHHTQEEDVQPEWCLLPP
jgi:hypothetical protein